MVISQSFDFQTARRILFGAQKLAEVPEVLRGLGVHKLLFVTGKRRERASGLRTALEANGFVLVPLVVAHEPTVELAREGTALCRRERCDGVLALGGGSVIDAGKAIAALATHDSDPLDHLEVIGRGVPLSKPSLPFVAIPSTAGTGAEVTRNAVLASPKHRVKASLRSPFMLPALAVVDPELLIGAPREVLRASGLDALAQLIEPFVSVRANPLTHALAREGLMRSARSLRRAVLEGPGHDAREDLALASLFGGLCLANAGLGAVHGFAAPVGGMFDAPHGAVCAALLPHVMATNLAALRERAPQHPALARFDELGALLAGDLSARADDAVAWVRALCADLEVPGLKSYGLRTSDVPELVQKAKVASSMKGNPIVLEDDELRVILERAL